MSSVLEALAPVPLNKWNMPIVDQKTQRTNLSQVFCGGDLAGVADTTVESVNDGKTAAWYMHCYLQVTLLAYEIYLLNKYYFRGCHLIHHQSCHCFILVLIWSIYRLKCVDLSLKIHLV